jgi:NTP pyrophosphatase (non-canonical NTP hydrolase)
VGKLLKSKGIDTPGIVAENLDPKLGLQFAIFETYKKEDDEIGFISQFTPERMKLLTPEMAGECVEALNRLHKVDVNAMSEAELGYFRNFSGKTDEFFDLIIRQDLEKRVLALGTGDEAVDVSSVLDQRLGVRGLHKKVVELLAVFRDVIEAEQKKEMVVFHGDFAPDNLRFGKKSVDLLDLEWAGVHDNEAIAMIIDYGNLRARVWNNKGFRAALDQAIIDKYKKEGNEELGRAIVALGILRSDIQIGGFFENYPREKQSLVSEEERRKGTQLDLLRAFELAGITLDTDQEKADFIPAKGHRELLAEMEKGGQANGELLKFDLGENSEQLTVYNPSPMVIDSVTYLWARVEDRSKETGSKAMLFREDGNKVWHIVEGAPVFGDLQDPFYCGAFDGKHIMGGVQVYEDPGSRNLGYRTVFYSFKNSLTELAALDGKPVEPFAVGPEKMKGIRFIQLQKDRIGVFTRPQGDFGGRGKMGYIEIESLDELDGALNDFDKIKDPSTFIYGLFVDDEWGGPNQLFLQPDGRIGVVGHIAGFGDDKYTTLTGKMEAKKDYYPIWFIFDPKTRTVSDVRILATTDQFPAVEAKQAQFGKILYSGGLVKRNDGQAWLYLGIGDVAAGRIEA